MRRTFTISAMVSLLAFAAIGCGVATDNGGQGPDAGIATATGGATTGTGGASPCVGCGTGGSSAVADITPPTVGAVTITSTTLMSGSPATVTATVTDNQAVASCNLFLNGVDQGSLVLTSGTWTKAWTTPSQSGTYTIIVICKDNAGNSGQSTAVTVTVVSNGAGGTGGTTVVSTGGSVALSTTKPISMCENSQTVGLTYNVNGYNFVSDFVAKPSVDGTALVVNPAIPFSSSTIAQCYFSGNGALVFYDLDNDAGQVVSASASKPGAMTSLVTSEGFRYSMVGMPPGLYHVGSVDGLNPANWSMWDGLAKSPNFPAASAQYIEKSMKVVKEPGSVGIVFYWNGSRVVPATATLTGNSTVFGGNYR